MGQSSEEYIELAEIWLRENLITGWEYHRPTYTVYSGPKRIKKTIKRKDLKVWEQ